MRRPKQNTPRCKTHRKGKITEKYTKKRRYPKNTMRIIGGEIRPIGAGSYGCVVRRGFITRNTEIPNTVSKIMDCRSGEKEMKQYGKIDKFDPSHKFHLSAEKINNNDEEIFKKCIDFSNDFKKMLKK